MSTVSASVADEKSVGAAPSTGNCIRELNPAEGPRETEPEVKPIAPLPEEWQRPPKKLNAEAFYNSLAYGLNIHQPPAADDGFHALDRRATILDLKPRHLRKDLEKLPEDAGMDGFMDLPVEELPRLCCQGKGGKKERE